MSAVLYYVMKGKIYKTEEIYGELILAFEKHPKDPDAKSRILSEIAPYLKKPAILFPKVGHLDILGDKMG